MKKPIDDNELKVQRYVESIRPKEEHIRKQLDIGYSYERGTFILFEIRPVFDMPDKIIYPPFAKIRCIKSRGIYKLYWMRGNGKWYLYDPFPESKSLDKIINEIEKNPCGCFD